VHGITSTLLSAVAVRSGEIVASLAASVSDRRPVPPAIPRPLVMTAERA
jgi:L-ornithine N5-oxygenase